MPRYRIIATDEVLRGYPVSQSGWVALPDDGTPWIYAENEIREIATHRGIYDPNHWAEKDPDRYNSLFWMNRHRLEGEAN